MACEKRGGASWSSGSSKGSIRLRWRRLPRVIAVEAHTVIDWNAELELKEYGGGVELYLSRLREYEVVALEAA